MPEQTTSFKRLISSISICGDEDPPLTMRQLLGFLVHQVEYKVSRRFSDLGSELLIDENSQSVTTTEAICLKHELNLTKQQMRTLRGYFTEKRIGFPNTNQLLSERKKLHPPILTSDLADANGKNTNVCHFTNLHDQICHQFDQYKLVENR